MNATDENLNVQIYMSNNVKAFIVIHWIWDFCNAYFSICICIYIYYSICIHTQTHAHTSRQPRLKLPSISWWCRCIESHPPAPAPIGLDPCLVFMMPVSVLITWSCVSTVNQCVYNVSVLFILISSCCFSDLFRIFFYIIDSVSTSSDSDSQTVATHFLVYL